MKQQISIFLLGVFMLTLTSCGHVLMFVFGMRNPKPYTDTQIIKEARKQKIPKEAVYTLDTSINQFFESIDTNKTVKAMLNNHSQPAQALYYNKEGTLESFHITCYAKGYRSKWNYDNSFDQFPPKTAAPIDTLRNLKNQLKYIGPIKENSLPVLDSEDYVVIVYFNRLIRGRNRRLVKEVKKNAKLIEDKKVKYLYVNSDNYWYYCLDVDFSEF